MPSRRPAFLLLAALVLAGCATDGAVTRKAFTPTGADSQGAALSADEARLLSQTRALQDMAADMVRQATLRGAGLGAAAGCGTALISAQGASRCLGGAVVGGLVGAAVGHEVGQRRLQHRLAGLSRDDLAQSLSRAHARLGTVRAGLAEVLAAQDAERAMLSRQRDAGEITRAEHDARLAEMARMRADIAVALTDTAAEGSALTARIDDLRAAGADGLDWHSDQARDFNAGVASARARISLI